MVGLGKLKFSGFSMRVPEMVNINKKLWKNPAFLMGKSTI